MKQEELISALFEMMGLSVNGLFESDNIGKNELAEIIRHTADFVESDHPTPRDLRAIFAELTAWCSAKLASFPEARK